MAKSKKTAKGGKNAPAKKKASAPKLNNVLKAEVQVVEKKLGHLAFIAGVIVAIIAGITADLLEPQVVTLVLLILGIVVGFMAINTKETISFLVASIALMAAMLADVILIPFIGEYLQAILSNIATFVAPAAIIVALKTVKKDAEE